MQPLLEPRTIDAVFTRLSEANRAFAAAYPGDPTERQPVHTVYGGAHLFSAQVAQKLGPTALRTMREYAGDFVAFARVLAFPGAETLPQRDQDIAALEGHIDREPDSLRRSQPHAWLALQVYRRVLAKLEREPIEDFRIDFEDGYGNRPDAEEDGHAVAAAEQMASGMEQGILPPFIGIRVKPLNEELRARSARTLDLFVGTLARKTGGRLPANFVVTIPKVTVPEQVGALVDLFEVLEKKTGLPSGSLRVELMIETPQSILDSNGTVTLPRLVAAARGRCRGAHFGTYDYTAGCNITAAYQVHTHPACDFARQVMQVSLAATGVSMSDGATTVMPIAPHRAAPGGAPLTPQQLDENRRAVHRAWKIHYDDVRHSLRHAFYQGWDLNPGQFPTRYAAVYAFFLEGRDQAGLRLRNFMKKAAHANVVGDVFDDAATGQGLLNYFLRGLNCGALTDEEALAGGLTLEELRTRSFVKILNARRARTVGS